MLWRQQEKTKESTAASEPCEETIPSGGEESLTLSSFAQEGIDRGWLVVGAMGRKG